MKLALEPDARGGGSRDVNLASIAALPGGCGEENKVPSQKAWSFPYHNDLILGKNILAQIEAHVNDSLLNHNSGIMVLMPYH